MFIVQMDIMNPRAANALDAKMYMQRFFALSEYLIVHETRFEIEQKINLQTLKEQRLQ